MRMNARCAAAMIAVLALLVGTATAGTPINVVPYGSLTCLDTVDFEPGSGFPDAPQGGTPVNQNSIISWTGPVSGTTVYFGERFAGQVVGSSGNFDVISGNPLNPVNILAGATNQNLSIDHPNAADQLLEGNSARDGGYPSGNAIGEGAIAILFDEDKSELGFDVELLSTGSVTVRFYRRTGGVPIDTKTITTNGPHGFRRDLSVQDIAAVVITNDDPDGIGIDNVCVSPTMGVCDAVVRLEACDGRDFVLPAQIDLPAPVTRPPDAIKVDVVFEDVGGFCDLTNFRAWGLEVEFDDTKLDFVDFEWGSFIEANFPAGSRSCQQVIGQPRVKVQAGVGVLPPADPGDQPVVFVTLCFAPDLGQNQHTEDFDFSTLNFTDDFGTEPQFLQLDIQPDFLTIGSELAGNGDPSLNLLLTAGDFQIIEETAVNFDVVPAANIISNPAVTGLPNDCNLAHLERYQADANCDGFVSTLDSDPVFDAAACGLGIVLPQPCFVKYWESLGSECPPSMELPLAQVPYVPTRSSRRVRLGNVDISGSEIARVPLEVQGVGSVKAFTLDFQFPSSVEVVDVEPAPEVSNWRAFGHGLPAPGSLRVLGAVGTQMPAIELSRDEWTILAYLVVRPVDDNAVAGRFELVGAWDDVEGVSLLGGGVNVAGASTDMPVEFALGVGRPNPSAGAVEIEFTVPAGPSRNVEIAIYNVQGQLVRSLVNGPQVAGRHTVSWDGRDSSGRPVAAGAYFSRMTADSFQQTHKIVQRR